MVKIKSPDDNRPDLIFGCLSNTGADHSAKQQSSNPGNQADSHVHPSQHPAAAIHQLQGVVAEGGKRGKCSQKTDKDQRVQRMVRLRSSTQETREDPKKETTEDIHDQCTPGETGSTR